MFQRRMNSLAAALGSSILAAAFGTAALAQQALGVPLGANTETDTGLSVSGLGQAGFSISIDGDTVAGAPAPDIRDRSADIRGLPRPTLPCGYDGLDTTRRLNVSTDDLRAAYRAGETITFRASMNYPAYVLRTEVRILDLGRRGNPLVMAIPIAPNGTADWTMPAEGPGELAYVLRTYDARGRYDETRPLALIRTERAFAGHETSGAPFVAAGEGEDRTRVRRIPVSGGTVTVSGGNARPGGTVTVNGEAVPVDDKGHFVTTRILPAGDRIVTIEIDGQRHVRDVTVPEAEWFRVGILDITAGWSDDESLGESESYVDGRAAIYARGKTGRGWTITGSLDTGEGPIGDIFERLNDKDPRRVLDRLRENDDDLYPTYGDDSTVYDDTPSRGRVYLRAENATTRFTWGDFTAGIDSGGLVANTRSLYGAELRHQSPDVTGQGEPRWSAQVYAATLTPPYSATSSAAPAGRSTSCAVRTSPPDR